jgi:hypothetical protein
MRYALCIIKASLQAPDRIGDPGYNKAQAACSHTPGLFGVVARVLTRESNILCVRRGERLYNVNVVFCRALLWNACQRSGL